LIFGKPNVFIRVDPNSLIKQSLQQKEKVSRNNQDLLYAIKTDLQHKYLKTNKLIKKLEKEAF
jgi:hypothetical protein